MFDTHVVRNGATTTVEVTGAIDASSHARLGATLDGALADGPAVLTIDLAGVEIMDSYGFAVLVGVRNELLASQTTRLVIGPRSSAVERLFQIMQLATAFEFEPPLVDGD